MALLLTGCAKGSLPSLQEILVNIGGSIDPIWNMITGAAYLFGFAFVFRGVYMLKVYGDMRTMMSSQTNLKGALICFLVGAVLLFSTSMYHSLLLTTFNARATSPLEYDPNVTLTWDAYKNLLRFIQLIGLISFFRGWMMLTHLSNPGQQHSFGKAMTHIFGGVLAINIQGTIDVMQGTLGMK